MPRTLSERPLSALLLLAALLVLPALAQAQEAPSRVISSEIALSRDAAEMSLEMEDGRQVTLRLDEDGSVRLNNERIGTYERRGDLDRSWRELLQRAMDAPTGELAGILAAWEAPAAAGQVGERLNRELSAVAVPTAREQVDPAMDDTLRRLHERIRELEQALEDPALYEDLERLEALDLPALRELRRSLEDEVRREVRRELRAEVRREARQQQRASPFRHIIRGISGVFSTLVAYAVLLGLGFLAVFFARPNLEAVADTARRQTLRAGLVGLAGSFLVLPAFILGALALAISIIGIVLLPVYLPLFPLAVVLAAVAGYLAVAHGAGEALAERRFRGTEWFTRANSYYYIVTGVGLLLVLFLAAHIVTMGGPWLGFLRGLLKFLAVMVTWAAFTIGFGAVLLTRGGTRPTTEPLIAPMEEEINV